MIALYSPNYPAIAEGVHRALAELHLPALPQDCVVLCGSDISPIKVAEHLGPGAGQVQVFHGGVQTFDSYGKATYLPSSQVEEEQEEVGRKWLEGEGGCLVTHNNMFGGCESVTAIFISRTTGEPGVRSGLLRGVARLVLLGNTKAAYTTGYNKQKLSGNFRVIEM